MPPLAWSIVLAAAAAAAFPIFYLRMFRINIPRMQRRFRDDSHPSFNAKFQNILRAFLIGSNGAAVAFHDAHRLSVRLDSDFEPFYRGFAYEGTGLGFGARASLVPRPGRKFEHEIHELDAKYLYQYYVGLGWFLKLRYGFRFGGYRRWLRSLDRRYAAVVFDGVGFMTALFGGAGREDFRLPKQPPFPRHYLRVYYQGVGRAMWFNSRFDLRKAIAALQYLPSAYRPDAYSGFGLAVAYSFFDKPILSVEAEKTVPSAYRLAFRQGLAFGWEARRLQNREYWEEQLAGQDSTVAARAERFVNTVHLARARLDANGARMSDTYYTRWMDETRMLLDEID